jgi:transcriptional regulator with XRE-family HTH domain
MNMGAVGLKDINLSNVIAARRREKGVTQEELASYAGVSKASVSKWEKGASLPDIALLPVLAAYFDISIDALMGYEPQLDKTEIKRIYQKLSAGFAGSPFGDVVLECEGLVKKYYSCYPFLLEIVQLYINHAPIAGDEERRKELLGEGIALCARIRDGSKDIALAERAALLQALCYLSLGKPEKVIELLGENIKPAMGGAAIISQAYQSLGKTEKANEVTQAELYHILRDHVERVHKWDAGQPYHKRAEAAYGRPVEVPDGERFVGGGLYPVPRHVLRLYGVFLGDRGAQAFSARVCFAVAVRRIDDRAPDLRRHTVREHLRRPAWLPRAGGCAEHSVSRTGGGAVQPDNARRRDARVAERRERARRVRPGGRYLRRFCLVADSRVNNSIR